MMRGFALRSTPSSFASHRLLNVTSVILYHKINSYITAIGYRRRTFKNSSTLKTIKGSLLENGTVGSGVTFALLLK